MSHTAFSCPNLSGSFHDQEEDLIRTIVQEDCKESWWKDETGETLLIMDGKERILQEEGDMKAFAKTYYQGDELVIDIRMDWGKLADLDLPARWFTAYRIDKFNNLVERIIPFKKDGTELSTEYVTFRRVKE